MDFGLFHNFPEHYGVGLGMNALLVKMLALYLCVIYEFVVNKVVSVVFVCYL